MPKVFPMKNRASSADIARLVELSGLPVGEVAARLGYDTSTLYRYMRGETTPRPVVVEKLKDLLPQRFARSSRQRAQFRFIDLFAGVGGMRLGVEAAGGRCVFSCEWNSFSRLTYQANFTDPEDHPFPEDINEVDVPRDIPEHDLLVAGFPCQPFSIAGVSKKNALGMPHGFDCHEQGNLFFKLRDVIREHRPAAFLLENVKNLQSHDKGRTFQVILHELRDKLGYEVHFRLINAKGFVPQNRERIFIVGFRRGTAFDFEKLKIPAADKGPKLGSILHTEDGTESPEPPYTLGDLAAVAPKYVLTEHLWSYLQAYAAKHRALGHGFGFGMVSAGDTTRTLSARYFKDGSEILLNRGPRKRPRRLTPRECSRLMGFDQPGRPFVIKVSDTQAYRQFGNAVVVPVVASVAKHIAPHLLKLMGGAQLQLALKEDLPLVVNG